MFVLDSHCDTPSQILRLRDLSLDNDHAHVDFPKLRRGGVDGAFFALYVPASMEGEEAYEYACRLMDCVNMTLAENPDKARLAVDGAAELAHGESAKFYIAVKPFSATPGTGIKLSVNGYEKEIILAVLPL